MRTWLAFSTSDSILPLQRSFEELFGKRARLRRVDWKLHHRKFLENVQPNFTDRIKYWVSVQPRMSTVEQLNYQLVNSKSYVFRDLSTKINTPDNLQACRNEFAKVSLPWKIQITLELRCSYVANSFVQQILPCFILESVRLCSKFRLRQRHVVLPWNFYIFLSWIRQELWISCSCNDEWMLCEK